MMMAPFNYPTSARVLIIAELKGGCIRYGGMKRWKYFLF